MIWVEQCYVAQPFLLYLCNVVDYIVFYIFLIVNCLIKIVSWI
nr:MAG TPA: Neurotransmitter-gated ion-channel transmembrane region [Crassvirales sp.]